MNNAICLKHVGIIINCQILNTTKNICPRPNIAIVLYATSTGDFETHKRDIFRVCILKYIINMNKLHSEILSAWNLNTILDLSPAIEDNDTLKCTSDNFPRWPNISGFMENCQNYISIYICSQIAGRRSWKVAKQFSYFSGPSPRDWRTMIYWNVVLTIFHKSWDKW